MLRPPAHRWREWGIDPAWSRTIDVPSHDGRTHRWHVLDRRPDDDAPGGVTLLCVHGNPTWSALWTDVVARVGARVRVVAVDQLGMGWSDRVGPRTFTQRVRDLGDVVDALAVEGPIVVAAHDWGGPIALGWVLANRSRVAGVVLCNTGVAVPVGRRAPGIIRLAARARVRTFVCRATPTFVEGTIGLSRGRLLRSRRAALRAPYGSARRRGAIADFVADIPLRDDHPSAAAIDEVAEGIRSLDVPVLLTWGGRDPVFDDDFAHDLATRMPHADLHRFARAGHLSPSETVGGVADVAGVIETWLASRVLDAQVGSGASAWLGVPAGPSGRAVVPPSRGDRPDPEFQPVWAALEARRDDGSVALVDGHSGARTSWRLLHEQVQQGAAALAAAGVRRGDRVAVLVPPGNDLVLAMYALWRAGAVTVVADRGLGLRGLGAAVRAAHVSWVIGPPQALTAAKVLRWAPRAGAIPVSTLRARTSSARPVPEPPGAHDPAAVVYTSGATGPAKGVRYRHGQLAAQRDALREMYGIRQEDRLVAAFAPFALFGPALGIASTIPDVDVTAPGTLTADALGRACAAIDGTIVFASPAALANVVRTAAGAGRSTSVRLVLSAGAPVPIATLRATARLCPDAELHTPYGMTECLPVSDVDLATLDAVGAGRGVCVGRPVAGVEVVISPLGFDAAQPVHALADSETGEVLVRAPWCSDGYDHLDRTERDARPADALGRVWHRTGDVGHLDGDGRLWIEGRSVHVVHTADGPVTPVPIEVAVERVDGVTKAAAVGVGPLGCQQLVVVTETAVPSAADGLADGGLAARVRAAVGLPVAAVLTARRLPVDIRHNTKIDRTAVAAAAAKRLSGEGR